MTDLATTGILPQATDPVWEDGSWAALPELAGEAEAEVCVIGLGGSGLAAVHELLGCGKTVVGLDAGAVAGGAAGRNGGFLLAGTAAFYHDAVAELGRVRARAIYQLTREEISRILAETPEAARRVGSLRIARSAKELADCRRQFEVMRADGLPVEPYQGPEGEGLLFPEDAAFDPLARCRTLARRALAQGARLFERSPALELSGREVRTPAGRVRCQSVIVAVDGRLGRVLPELAGQVRTARLQMLATAPIDELRAPRPVYLRYGYEYYQQLPDGRLALGGFRDRGGLAEWTEDTRPEAAVQARLEHFLRIHLGLRAPVTHRWAASVGYTRGILPLFAKVRAGVWAAGGYNGTGNVIGAILGRAAAQLAATGTSALAVPFLGRASR